MPPPSRIVLQAVARAPLLQGIHEGGHDPCAARAHGCPIAIAPPLTSVLGRSAPVSADQASVGLTVLKCLRARDGYNNRAGRDDPKAMDKFEHGENLIHGEKLIEAQKRIALPRRQLAS
jgi:hypothetical protein